MTVALPSAWKARRLPLLEAVAAHDHDACLGELSVELVHRHEVLGLPSSPASDWSVALPRIMTLITALLLVCPGSVPSVDGTDPIDRCDPDDQNRTRCALRVWR